MASLKERIIHSLLSRHLIQQSQLDEALAVQRAQGGSLQQILVERGFVNEPDLLAAVSEGLGIPLITLSRLKLDPSLKGLVSREMASQYQLIPVACIGRTLTVAMVDPMNVFALDMLAATTGLTVNPLMASPKDLQDAIDQYYGTGVEETLQEMVRQAETDSLQVMPESQVEGEEQETEAQRLLRQTQEAPVIRLTDALLTKAVRLHASDLLIEPLEKSVCVRYRVDGVLQEGEAPPKPLHAAVVSRLKVMSELNIAERRLPQDGHFNFLVDDRLVDFRISVLPSVFGGHVCLRVLDKGDVRLSIDALGFSPDAIQTLKTYIRRPHGMILATGPTGSGKTTTLYSLLKLIDSPEKNIVTVEDPVEFNLTGINQVNTRADIELTFAKALRSILRQDPNIIMVGEIRDAETADMAVKSALTGHLVLSTLHTNSAVGSVVRLINMGMEPFLINSCLMVVIGQRLVRKICAKCAEAYHPPKALAEQLGLLGPDGEPLELSRGRGCRTCFQSGYAGREVIAEVLVMTPEVRELILRRATERDLEAAACRAGMQTLREQGLQKVRARTTTLEEVFRTTTGEVVG
jgi:type IV pilus assembly protein PilB